MKQIITLLTVLIFTFQVSGQGCYEPIKDFIRNIEEVNTYEAGFHFALPGKSLDRKAEYFVDSWVRMKMSRINSKIGYTLNQSNVNTLNLVSFTQTFDGKAIEGTQLVLGFDMDGYLKQFSHYGIDDSGQIEVGKTIKNLELISEKEDAFLTADEDEYLKFVNGRIVRSARKMDDTHLLKSTGPPPPPSQMVSGSIWVGTMPPGYTYMCDGDIATQNGLEEVGVGGSQAGSPNDRLTLVEVNGKYKIADSNLPADIIYSGSTNYAHGSTDYLICPEQPNTVDDPAGKFEYAMCYHYLTQFSEFFDANIALHGVNDFGSVIFDPYDGAGSLTYTVTSDKLTFGAADNDVISGYHDLAEDVHFIAEGGAHYWWKNNFDGVMPSEDNTGDGVLYGTLDYLASQFTGGSLNVLSWGGNGTPRTVALNINEDYDSFVNAGNSAQANGQLWGSTLNDVATEGQLGSSICNQLLARAMNIMNGGTGQIEAAIILFNQGKDMRDEMLITNQQLCVLAEILDNRYPNAEINILAKDVYIKDSYAGQQTSYATNAEDMGQEPSLTSNFWISPAIWNRYLADQGTTHQSPKHNQDELNYLHVEVRDRGCEKPSGVLKMYFSEASTGHVWPEDWDNTTPTNAHLGYFVGSVNLSNNVAQYFDNNNELVYLYIIPWIPIDATEFDGYEDGDNMHGCILGRIVSNEDPMANEQENIHVSVNSKNNNNIAMRNMTVMHIESKPGEPPSEPNGHVLVIKHGKTPDLNNLNPVRDAIKINVVRGGLINPDELFEYGNIEIELSDILLNAWINGGMKGQNVEYVKPNKVVIFKPDATIENLVIDPLRKHPIRVRFDRKRDLPHVAEFDITLWNENECEVGGEMYQIAPGTAELDLRSLKSVNESNGTTLAPNPVSDELLVKSNVEFTPRQIKIFNVEGRIFSPEMVTKTEKLVLINTSSLQSGIYFVNIERENGDFENMKFIKL